MNEEGLYEEVTLADLNPQVHKVICNLPFLFKLLNFQIGVLT